MSRNISVVGGALLAVALTGTLMSGAAVAHHSLSDNMYKTSNYDPNCASGSMGATYCQTDNSALTVFRQTSLTAANRSLIASMLNNQYVPTDLTLTYHTADTVMYSGSAETDIIYQVNSSVPSGLDGITWCNNAVTTTKCDQHYVAFDSNAVVTNGMSCHETGHAIGLTHGAEASPSLGDMTASLECMATPVASGEPLGSHNAYWVNNTY